MRIHSTHKPLSSLQNLKTNKNKKKTKKKKDETRPLEGRATLVFELI